MRFTVALAALLLLSSCHDPAPVAVNSPEFTTVRPEEQPQPRPPGAASATSAVCNKSQPSADYSDRAAECVEVSGPASIAAGSNNTYTCRGWGRSNLQANDWYEVSTQRPRSWSSSNQSILQVSETSFPDASVSGVAPGTASVNCRIDGVLGSLEVTVTGTRTLQSMFILPNSVTLTVGQSQDVTVHFVDNFNQVDKIHPAVDRWETDAPAVATVTGGAFGGQVATVNAVGTPSSTLDGIAHVWARVGTMPSSNATVTVHPTPVVTSVSVTPTSATIAEYTYTQLTATALDQFGRVMTGRSAIWSTNNQNNVSLSLANPMSVYVQGLHWGQANVYSQVDGVPGNTVPITITTDGQISGYYVSALSPWGNPFTAPGTYYLTPTTSTAGTPPITYKWVIEYADGSPTITTGYQSGSYPLSVHSGSYKIYVTVTPKQLYGAGYPTRWTYNVCTGSGGQPQQPLASPNVNAGSGGRTFKPNSNGDIIQKVVAGCAGGTN